MMKRLLLVLLTLFAGDVAAKTKAAPPPPETLVDVTSVKDKLQVATDGAGHYAVFVPGDSSWFFWGTATDLWKQRVFGYSSEDNGKVSFDFTFWEPRVGFDRWKASFGMKNKKYEMQCEDRKTELKLVTGDEAKKVLDGAKFHDVRWKHQAYALARDTKGNYYYVDKQREPEGNKLFRVWTGPKGSMKQAKMKNIVSDSEGDIFITKSGELRLVLDKSEQVWVKGKKQTKLVPLPIEDNAKMIYSELGVYTGQSLGTPCDDI